MHEQRTPKQIAELFSTHQFEKVYPYLAHDMRWNNVGGEQFYDKASVVAACQQSAEYLAKTNTMFDSFKLFHGHNYAVVDAVARYESPDGTTSTVSSCDIYEFVDEKVQTITSYTVELE